MKTNVSTVDTGNPFCVVIVYTDRQYALLGPMDILVQFVTYFIEVIRMVVMKGSELKDLKQHFIMMSCFAMIFNTLAVLNYRKTA